MIKTLKKRFIVTAMSAISILLIILLGIINIANAWYLDRESDRVLDMLSAVETFSHRKPPPKSRPFFSPPHEENSRMSALYFTVKENAGDTSVDLSRISSITEQEARILASKAEKKQTESGKISNFKFRLVRDSANKAYVFLDTTTQRYAILRIAALSLLAGFLTWLLMLLFVILLSKRAINPIAENMERQKQFVTDAGHEIKTPLAIILANTEAMELRSGETKWSKNIKEQISRLDRLMRDLLALAKSDEAQTKPPFEEINLSDMLSSCIEMFLEPAALSEIEIERNFEDGIKLITNKEGITRIISTLLDNAVKYATSKSKISVSLSQTDKATKLSIQNECTEIPDCSPERLFDRFYRGDSARTQKSGGFGIGLSAARATASLLGGELSARYENNNSIVFTLKI